MNSERQRLIEEARRLMRDEGLSQREAGRRVGLSKSAANRWLKDDAPEIIAVEEPGREIEVPTEIPVIFRDYTHLESLRVYPLGDVHKGAPVHHREKWRTWLKYLVGEQRASMLGTGDFLNAALKDSKSEAYDDVMTVGKAKRELRRELTDLADEGRIDGLAPGNHEARIYRATGDCPILDLCDSLDVPYVRAAALFVYLVGDQSYEVYLRHGTGSGQSLQVLSKSQNVILADVYVTGHTHRQGVSVDDFFVRDGDRVVRKRLTFLSSGSFLGYEQYAAERGYTPSRIGAPRLYLDGRRHDVHVSL